MGNICNRAPPVDPDSAWQQQNKELKENPIYRLINFQDGGKLIKALTTEGPDKVREIARAELEPYLFYGGKGSIITKLDYVKWHRAMQIKMAGGVEVNTKTDQELLAEFPEDFFNKVVDHEACWDIKKRGGVGETPCHLLYLMDKPEATEVAMILLEMYPKLSLDVYEGEEYFGESALHLAIVFGNFELVKKLVECGAKVNQRATGRFFLPEDQKPQRKKETNYEGYAYYGEYPLAFAASFGNKEIYDYLIDHDADPNLRDSFGNTVLHMTVIADQPAMYKYAVKHHKKPAKPSIKNSANLTPLTLASKLGRHEIFKEMLDLSSMAMWTYSNIACQSYPLASIDSIGPHGGTNWSSALMIIVNGETDEHLDMLEGGVIRQLLDDKWKTFARTRFIQRLIIAFLHLALISIAVYTRPGSDQDLLAYNKTQDLIRFISEGLVIFSCVITIIMEAIEVGSQGIVSFFKNCAHAPDQTVFLISCVLIMVCIPFRFLKMPSVEEVLLVMAVPGAWFFLLFFARGVKLTGPFVTMIYKMCTGDLIRFGLIYMVFLIAFTQAFFFLFRDVDVGTNSDVAKFQTIGENIMSLFQMTLGEFKYDAFSYAHYKGLTLLVFGVFMILVPILLLNMLIAMMGNTYQQVIAKQEKEWRKQWAKIVVVLERGFSKKRLLAFQREYSIRMSGPPKDDPEFDPTAEVRALVVIKTTAKTKARIRKAAINYWKMLGKEIVRQIRNLKRDGKFTGSIELNQSLRRKRSLKSNVMIEDSTVGSESDLLNAGLASTVAQLAWEKDIDLTKGQTFITDPEKIENLSPRAVSLEPQIANGRPKQMDKSQSKASGGAEKHGGAAPSVPGLSVVTSPKVRKAIAYNRVAPLVPSLSSFDSTSFPPDSDDLLTATRESPRLEMEAPRQRSLESRRCSGDTLSDALDSGPLEEGAVGWQPQQAPDLSPSITTQSEARKRRNRKGKSAKSNSSASSATSLLSHSSKDSPV